MNLFQYADDNQLNMYKKFPKDHLFGSQTRCLIFIDWVTFFRKNLDKFAETYLGLKLYLYQRIMLYLLGISDIFAAVACRAAAKSFIISIYAVSECILRPGQNIVIVSGTRGQAKLIVTEKIKNELMRMSPTLRNEIESIKDSQIETTVYFKNSATITVVTASDNARGHRANVIIAEEFRMIPKEILDSVILPFLVGRKPPYLLTDYYSNIAELQEESKQVYISSAWLTNSWMWTLMKQILKDMLDGKKANILALDYAIVLKHRIKTKSQLSNDKKTLDPITWQLEYDNVMLRENTGAYFTYTMLNNCQTLKKAFYPRRIQDGARKFLYPKQDGEIRVISCDIAMIDNALNDQSSTTLLRLLPESETDIGEDKPRVSYRVQVPYMEAHRGAETVVQATRIKQLFYLFDADYCVLDCRNAGIAIAGALGKVLYDSDFDKEYPPWCIINDDVLAKHTPNPNGAPVLYAFTASSKLNSEMAVNLRTLLVDKRIDLLVGHTDGIEELRAHNNDYIVSNDGENQYFYEKPYLETQALIAECAGLQYEKMENTGAIKLKEQSGAMKDRYSSLGMGTYFAKELEQDLSLYMDEEDFINAPSCVSKLSW